MNAVFTTVDEYIQNAPREVQDLLRQMRHTIKTAAPEAEEVISYAMPTYRHHGNLVHFAAFKNHIGFYPVPSAIGAFKKDLEVYKAAKGSAQFPLNQPLPLPLIERIVKYRVEENEQKTALKKSARKCKNGHTFYKTTDSPTCPICENEKEPEDGFLARLSAPARRALENSGITTVKQLAKHSKKEVLDLHGMGPASLPKLEAALQEAGLSFRKTG